MPVEPAWPRTCTWLLTPVLPTCIPRSSPFAHLLRCATTALGSSVNLPAMRVIFRDAYKAYSEPKNWLTARG